MFNQLLTPSLVAAATTPREQLLCPLCGEVLRLDPWWHSPHWLCAGNHSYSNLSVLDEELQARAVSSTQANVRQFDRVE